jgi:adenine-specific DNA-methyltransferase
MGKKTVTPKTVETIKHDQARRKNIPTAEHQSVIEREQEAPRKVKHPRNIDLDPQLVWRGKDEQNWSDLVINAPPLYIQEKVHPKVLIDDLMRRSKEARAKEPDTQIDLFADFNGMPPGVDRTEFYQHDQNWSNRMILGDSLQVMASLCEREGLRGKVQCIYIDPPYGIKFNSNFQWSTTSNKVTDGKADQITREPEQVKAFRDTWRDGVHSYLTYLRDRLAVAHDLLTESGSVFVQIGDENVHRVRSLLDEVFGAKNVVSQILYRRGGFQTSGALPNTFDYILWYSKSRDSLKYRSLYVGVPLADWFAGQQVWVESNNGGRTEYVPGREVPADLSVHTHRAAYSASGGESSQFAVQLDGIEYLPPAGRGWSTNPVGFSRLRAANRLMGIGRSLRFKPYYHDFPFRVLTNGWMDTVTSGFGEDKVYVVQTSTSIVQRCVLMTSDPGDLVLDPTCGSGTTAIVAEQWGRRWITIDTSRVALARARIMGARYPYYLLADSREGKLKQAEVSHTTPSSQPTFGSIRHGFVHEPIPHITLADIVHNTEIDVIRDNWQTELEPLRKSLNSALTKTWQEWEPMRGRCIPTGGRPA